MSVVDNLIKILKKNKINFFTGVPDSVLKPLSLKLSNLGKKNHIITANEGGSVSLATGYFLATKKIALVYLQNSGLGNIVNPITSMIHKNVYGIPMLLFIGWRGAPKIKDEIQHNVQGKITLKQLKLLDIPYKIFNKNVVSIWNLLCHALVGESMSVNKEFVASITGLTISPKKNFCIIKIWVSNCNYQDQTSLINFESLNTHNCIFKKHIPEY